MVSTRVEYLWEKGVKKKKNHTHKMLGPFGSPTIGPTQLDFLTSAPLSQWMHTTPEKGISLDEVTLCNGSAMETGTWKLVLS